MKNLIVTLGIFMLMSCGLQAQNLDRFVEKNKNRAVRKTEMCVNRKVDKGVDKSLDATEKGAEKAVKSDPQKKEARRKRKAEKQEAKEE